MSRYHPEDVQEPQRLLNRRLDVATKLCVVVASATVLTGATVEGATIRTVDDVYVPTSPVVSTEASPTNTPTPTTAYPEASMSPSSAVAPTPTEQINATCRPGIPASVTWDVMGIQGAPIELFGLDPDTGGLAKTKDPHAFGVYSGGPQVGSMAGNVLTGGERFRTEGKSLFPPDYEKRLATVAVGSVVVFTMKDGGRCEYRIDQTFLLVGKFRQAAGAAKGTTEYAVVVGKYNLYTQQGTPGIEIEGCTGTFDPRQGTSDSVGIAVGHLRSDERP